MINFLTRGLRGAKAVCKTVYKGSIPSLVSIYKPRYRTWDGDKMREGIIWRIKNSPRRGTLWPTMALRFVLRPWRKVELNRAIREKELTAKRLAEVSMENTKLKRMIQSWNTMGIPLEDMYHLKFRLAYREDGEE